ncbi:MAG: Fur family transcriptional regulator [Deinococcales bacterium]
MQRRHTKQRETILSVLESAEGPLSIPEIHTRAKALLPNLGLATIYRAIHRLTADTAILEVALPGEETRFEVRRGHHHHHFRCQKCHKVFELDFCPVQLPHGAVLPNGYAVFDHHLTLYGLCKNCNSRAMQ